MSPQTKGKKQEQFARDTTKFPFKYKLWPAPGHGLGLPRDQQVKGGVAFGLEATDPDQQENERLLLHNGETRLEARCSFAPL